MYGYEDAASDLAMARFADACGSCDAEATMWFLHRLRVLAPSFTEGACTDYAEAVRDMCEGAAQPYCLDLHRERDGLTVTSNWGRCGKRLRIPEEGEAVLEDDKAGDGDE